MLGGPRGLDFVNHEGFISVKDIIIQLNKEPEPGDCPLAGAGAEVSGAALKGEGES